MPNRANITRTFDNSHKLDILKLHLKHKENTAGGNSRSIAPDGTVWDPAFPAFSSFIIFQSYLPFWVKFYSCAIYYTSMLLQLIGFIKFISFLVSASGSRPPRQFYWHSKDGESLSGAVRCSGSMGVAVRPGLDLSEFQLRTGSLGVPG